MKPRTLLTCLVLATIANSSSAQETATSVEPTIPVDKRITLDTKQDRVTVHIDGEMFTEYIFSGYEKPILYPIMGPHGIGMTRNWPMKDGIADEARDHPHHKSIWFGHMKVNDESFWHAGDSAGTTQQTELVSAAGDTIKTTNQLVHRDGKTIVATDTRTIRFRTDGDVRMIDYEVVYHATQGDVLFGDNKDGQMGIRMHPALRVQGKVATGQAVNSAGNETKDVWGKRAAWIDYWGQVDGQTVGIAMFDHPSNFRHPTWWHAREYGLLSANPFGIHHFEERKEPVGEHTLKEGKSLGFRHLFVFHDGNAKDAEIARRYEVWSKLKN